MKSFIVAGAAYLTAHHCWEVKLEALETVMVWKNGFEHIFWLPTVTTFFVHGLLTQHQAGLLTFILFPFRVPEQCLDI